MFLGCVGYAIFEDKYGALDIGELTAPRKPEDIAADQQARIEAGNMDDTSWIDGEGPARAQRRRIVQSRFGCKLIVYVIIFNHM